MTLTILRIDASARRIGSVSRELATDVVKRFEAAGPVRLINRDLADGVPLIDEDWVTANFTPPADRSPAQAAKLSVSDRLVDEIREADVLVIGLPIYNFGVPAAFKAWIDQIARAGETFEYSEAGPRGLLTGKRAVLAVASGGTETGSEIDFATTYARHALAFVGITEVDIVAADRLMLNTDAALEAAARQVAALNLAA